MNKKVLACGNEHGSGLLVIWKASDESFVMLNRLVNSNRAMPLNIIEIEAISHEYSPCFYVLDIVSMLLHNNGKYKRIVEKEEGGSGLIDAPDNIEIFSNRSEYFIDIPMPQGFHALQNLLKPISDTELWTFQHDGSLRKRRCVEHGRHNLKTMGVVVLRFRKKKIQENVRDGVQVIDEFQPAPNAFDVITQRWLAALENLLNRSLLFLGNEYQVKDVPVFVIQETKNTVEIT